MKCKDEKEVVKKALTARHDYLYAHLMRVLTYM